MTQSVPVILDVDTGVDDACALLLAALNPGADLRAVTCVIGNTSVEKVVSNMLKVLEVAGRLDVPVAGGAARPLIGPAGDARHVHGDDGMVDLGWPALPRMPDRRPAVELLRDLLSQAAHGGPADRVTLVPLAPLTNIAHDPEAAAIVLESAGELNIPVLTYGLDVFYDVRVSRRQAAELRAVGGQSTNRPAELAGRLIEFQCGRFGQPDATIGDAGAVCAVIDRAGLKTSRLPVWVELAGLYSRGRTIADRRDWSGDIAHDQHGMAPTSVDVAVSVDAQRYAGPWLRTMRGGTR